ASQAGWGSDNQVRAGEPLLLLGQAQPQVDRYRRRTGEQARVERDHEVFARRHRDRDALRALELPRSSQRGVAQLGVGQATLEPLDRNAVGVPGGGGVDPVGHDRHGSLARVQTTWQSAGDYEDIRYETAVGEDAGVAKITINRPEVRNAFRPETVVELSAAFTEAREDAEVGVVILTGEGPDAFCSGGDQRVRGEGGYVGDDGIARLNVLDLQRQIRTLPKPVVAMVAGYAVGGGHVLHMMCDLTIAAENARFGQTGPRVGSFDGGYGAAYMARIVGQKKAREIWFLCRQYDAKQALEMGLVNAVVPLAELET